MGNLGVYQWMTTTSKKVGGPINFLLLIGTGGAVASDITKVVVKKIKRTVKQNKEKKQKNIEARIYTILTPGKSADDVAFAMGDQFRVLESDGDAVLIKKIEDDNNPYFVSAALLRKISDYN